MFGYVPIKRSVRFKLSNVLVCSWRFFVYQQPDLSMRQYQIGAPRLKDICLKYGVPYVQETIWERLRKTTDIMVGKATMRSFPTEYEAAKDKSGKDGLTWKSSNGAIEED
jgi:hypothetical protein